MNRAPISLTRSTCRDIPGRKNRGNTMRAHPAIAIATVILVGFGVKLAFFPAPIASADRGSAKSVSMDASERRTKDLPVQKIHDTTFVFSNDD